ncbi:unnamed protein product [Rotaria magnacalcarata]|uniref:Uncharacterized protein n=2 Tax=Rotaria magnacalcarata TaxID=392030 RepID=A0A816Z1F8_9BILA|nr:unnamed protein product [Rotaria magnacalcarata]CAF1600527.1 unnamed protein product [Rotaria magnacalcarata]CAF1949907.1 unnamed protein product [Rotaria magnacalcarata]CAF2184327.1 unnamed protein product [Rotaria magnacalcarata]CAF3981731.1 unnamed protein product [Rotaria magnacalcarata]
MSSSENDVVYLELNENGQHVLPFSRRVIDFDLPLLIKPSLPCVRGMSDTESHPQTAEKASDEKAKNDACLFIVNRMKSMYRWNQLYAPSNYNGDEPVYGDYYEYDEYDGDDEIESERYQAHVADRQRTIEQEVLSLQQRWGRQIEIFRELLHKCFILCDSVVRTFGPFYEQLHQTNDEPQMMCE